MNPDKNLLSANPEDYLSGLETIQTPQRNVKCRSATPEPFLATVMESQYLYEEDMPYVLAASVGLRSAASATSILDSPNSSSESSSLNSLPAPKYRKHYKSIDNLCFGRGRKIRHRKSQVTEVYRPRSNTDPEDTETFQPYAKKFSIPILRIPEDEISNVFIPQMSEGKRDSQSSGSAASESNLAGVAGEGEVSGGPGALIENEQNKLKPKSDNALTAVGGGAGVLGTLIKQTLKVTTAPMGLIRTASAERLSSYPLKPLTKDVKHRFSRSTSSVSTLAYLPTESNTPMAPLQQNTEAQSVQCLNTSSPKLNQQQENQQQQQQQQQQSAKRQTLLQHQLSTPEPLLRSTTPIGCTASATSTSSSSDYSSARSLKDNQSTSASLNPLQTVDSSSSVRSISPSRRSAGSNGSSTAKHESTAAATAAQQSAGAAATTSNASPSTSNAVTTTTTPPSSEKEKKRKEISSSRVKKFHRHFAQVSKDEKLINYFSCALVSDILLQGHLYITDQHFAFYSNVFGYVTKVVIPTSSVTKISKEKTAKIIPNAVGVATADERHVFGSFISREAAFRLMCSVCPPLIPVEILPKDPANIEICEEYSIEDDSSCSISGNESPAQAGGNSSQDSQGLLRRSNLSIPESSTGAAEHIKLRHSDIPFNANSNNQQASLGLRASAPPTAPLSHSSNGTMSAGGDAKLSSMQQQQQPAATAAHTAALIAGLVDTTNIPFIVAGSISTSTTSANSTPTASTTSSPTTVMTPMGLRHSKVQHLMDKVQIWSKNLALKIKYPTEIRVVYLGVLLTIILAVFSIFLLYRILDIEAKATIYRSPIDFNWQSPNDDGILAEALRFQKELQQKTTEEAQNILKTNLEQIAKVRRSLETLSTLIHDRSGSSFATTVHTDDSD